VNLIIRHDEGWVSPSLIEKKGLVSAIDENDAHFNGGRKKKEKFGICYNFEINRNFVES